MIIGARNKETGKTHVAVFTGAGNVIPYRSLQFHLDALISKVNAKADGSDMGVILADSMGQFNKIIKELDSI